MNAEQNTSSAQNSNSRGLIAYLFVPCRSLECNCQLARISRTPQIVAREYQAALSILGPGLGPGTICDFFFEDFGGFSSVLDTTCLSFARIIFSTSTSSSTSSNVLTGMKFNLFRYSSGISSRSFLF